MAPSNMSYRGRDDQAVWGCAVGRKTWQIHCQFAPWKSNEALFVFCGQRVWNLLKSTEEWRFSMETVVWVREECMNGWKDFKTDDKMSVMNTGVVDQLAWQVRQLNSRSSFFLEGIRKLVDRWTKCVAKHEDYVEKLDTNNFCKYSCNKVIIKFLLFNDLPSQNDEFLISKS